MKINELNQIQEKSMEKDVLPDHYEWSNKALVTYLLGKLPLERERNRNIGKELSENESKQNDIIRKINEIINRYNFNMIINKEKIQELKNYYAELEQYIELYYTFYDNIIKELKFNKVFLIRGPGGIGKSQFLYEFSKELSKKFNYLCIYGKYCKNIEESIYTQIKKVSEDNRFYLIIDAINEFDGNLRNKILEFIKDNKNNENLRIIISYRDFSLESNEVNKISSIIDEEEIFTGIDSENALEKIAEKYNLDLSIYNRLLYDNNPLHLKLIINTISKNQLRAERLKPITRGTYIYEQFIKKVLSKPDWKFTKEIIEIMFKNKSKELNISELKDIDIIKLKEYIKKMRVNNFIETYEFDNNTYLYFVNETLTDYLIVRFLMDDIENLEMEEIENKIEEIVKIFYSIHDQIILMLFEKYEDNIETAIRIIRETTLYKYLNIEIFNETNLSEKNIKKIKKNLKPKMNIKDIFVSAGGNEDNPYNCKNFLNSKLIRLYKNKQLKFEKYDNKKIKSKLKIYVQTMSKYNYDNNYIEEKFWYAVWCSASVDKINRALSKKLIFEIINVYPQYIKKLILLYQEINDEYIQEMIIEVLASTKKNNIEIKRLFNKINDEKLCNINMLYCISSYLYGEENYEKFKKINLIEDCDKRRNKKIVRFLNSVFFTHKYDYNFLGFNAYNSAITFSTKFIKENKNNIIKINRYIKENFKCLNATKCNDLYFKENLIDNKFKVDESFLEDNKIYLAWQKIFKKYLNKYNIKIKELEKSYAYEESDKGIVYKALDLSILYINGSITCNFYTNQFELYGEHKGYQFNLYDKYNEKAGIYYPIAVFNQNIESLNNKIIKKIELPKKKNLKWVRDSELGIKNIKEIIQPIKYRNEEYCMIYGNIRLDEKSDDKYGNNWIDTYIINLAIDENYNLTNISDEDRKYTIETKSYKGNLLDYIYENYTMTTGYYSSSELNNLYATTDFRLPPTAIIRDFNLHYDKFSSSWKNLNKEEVILVNNNEGMWYRKGCSGSIYLKKTYYDELMKKHEYKYFCFTEKYHPKTGYCADSALQVQINSDNTIYKYKHYKNHKYRRKLNNSICKNCIVYKEEKKGRKITNNINIEEILMN